MFDVVEKAFIGMAMLIAFIVLSCFGVLFLIDISFDTIFGDYGIIQFICLIVGIIIVIISWMCIYERHVGIN